MRSNASASWPSTLTSSCSSARYISLKLLISMATLSSIREFEMHRKLPGDGTEKREAGHPELMFAQRGPRSVCSREFYFFVIHDGPIACPCGLIRRADVVFA